LRFIICKECSSNVSDEYSNCTHCGATFTGDELPSTIQVLNSGIALHSGLMGWLLAPLESEENHKAHAQARASELPSIAPAQEISPKSQGTQFGRAFWVANIVSFMTAISSSVVLEYRAGFSESAGQLVFWVVAVATDFVLLTSYTMVTGHEP
jgi:hypothetical protein